MKLGEVLQFLIKENALINQSNLAHSLGVTRQTVSTRIKNNSEVTVSEIQKIENFFNISLGHINCINAGSLVTLDYYPEVFVSCGSGTVTFSDEKYPMVISKNLINNYCENNDYSIITVKGDSMSPLINSGDKLIVEHNDFEQIEDNRVYVFCYKQELFVKRLSKNIDEVIVKSDNAEYATRIISPCDINYLTVIGKVVGLMRDGI